MYVCMHIYIYVYVCICVCVYIYIYIYIDPSLHQEWDMTGVREFGTLVLAMALVLPSLGPCSFS